MFRGMFQYDFLIGNSLGLQRVYDELEAKFLSLRPKESNFNGIRMNQTSLQLAYL